MGHIQKTPENSMIYMTRTLIDIEMVKKCLVVLNQKYIES